MHCRSQLPDITTMVTGVTPMLLPFTVFSLDLSFASFFSDSSQGRISQSRRQRQGQSGTSGKCFASCCYVDLLVMGHRYSPCLRFSRFVIQCFPCSQLLLGIDRQSVCVECSWEGVSFDSHHDLITWCVDSCNQWAQVSCTQFGSTFAESPACLHVL